MVNKAGGWGWVELGRQYSKWPRTVGEDVLTFLTAVLVAGCNVVEVDFGSHVGSLHYLKLSAPNNSSVVLR